MNTNLIIAAQTAPRLPDSPDWLSGGALLAYGLLALFLAVLWLIFPFIVYAKFNELIRATKRTEARLEEIERNTRKPTDPAAPSSVGYSIKDESSAAPIFFGILAVVILGIVIAVIVNRR